MLTPGFIIKNETIWPLQISLNQVGPLYYDVIQPGQSFVRDTGAVWFTVKAAVFLDEKDRITDWDAILPVAIIVGTVIIAAVTAGAAAYAGGPALAAAGAAGVSGVTGLSSASALATATAASALVGAGFSASASLVIGGAVVGGGIGAALSATATSALKDVFKKDNIAASSAGCYAGPPWPFRRELTPLVVRGGPTFKQVPGQNQVEIVGAPLVIEPEQPAAPYGAFELQTGTALSQTDAAYRMLLSSNRDVFAIKRRGTGTGTTEVHVLAADKTYQAFALQTRSALPESDDTWDFAIGPNRDLYAIKRSATGSGTTEIHVVDARSGYQKFALQTRTGLHETDGKWAFLVAANRDVFAIKKSGGAGSTEIHILSASSNYQKFALQTPTALGETDDSWTFGIAPNRDVFAIKKHATGSRTTEVHVLSAGSEYRAFALQTKTALHETDNTWEFAVASNRDVFAIKKSNTASGSTEIHVLR